MMLIDKTRSLSRISLIALTLTLPLATRVTLHAGALPAPAIGLEGTPEPADTAEQFAGTWHWMFGGRSFSTMVLVRRGSGFAGTVTPSRIALNDEGGLLRADAAEDSTPKTISNASLKGSALRITVGDGFAFIVTLKDDTHAEIRPVGAPANMKPITAEKVR
jgi:hypothetical protein